MASRDPDIAENVGSRFDVDHVLTPRCAEEVITWAEEVITWIKMIEEKKKSRILRVLVPCFNDRTFM